MQKWETAFDVISAEKVWTIDQVMNAKGLLGWEHVSTVFLPFTSEILITYKRPLAS